jgi:integrase
MAIVQRNKKYHLRREVPVRFWSVEDRKIIWLSLHTGDEEDAKLKASVAWRQLLDGWQARLDGDTADAERRFAAAKQIAVRRGFTYLPATEVAELPLADRMERVAGISIRRDSPDRIEAAALLGAVKEPGVTVEKALEVFWEHEADKEIGKSEDQIRRWKNPKIKAVKNLIAQIGNKELAAISRADMLKFRDWWRDKMRSEGLVANSANKDLIHVGHVIRTANERLSLGLDDQLGKALENLSFRDDKDESRDRPPFSDEWIKSKILAQGALANLNKEARCILLALINTGARPSEVAGLMPEHISLEGPVPFISIEPEGRKLKNAQSKRQIPLVGISLAAFRECPEGFPTYRFKDKISATLNSFMRENALMETNKHVLYSFRHAFEDRMIKAEFDDRMRRTLFGHKLNREKYGNGPTLAHMHEKLVGIAI